jgi:F-box/WD-40 domain protein 7
LQADAWRIISAADDKTLKMWSLDSGRRLVTFRKHDDGVTCVQFNDFMMVSGSYDKTVKLWDFRVC